jgi:hypothetical protein
MVPVGSFISEALDIGQPSKAWQPLDLGNGIMKDKDRPDDFIIHLGWQSRRYNRERGKTDGVFRAKP